jgi:hypothetical protein
VSGSTEVDQGVDVEGRILRRVNAGDQDLGLFVTALARRALPDRGPSSWLLDRLFFLYVAFVRMPRATGAPVSPAGRSVVYDPGAWRAGECALRAHFIEHYFGDNVDFLLTDLLKGTGGSRRATAHERRLARRWRRYTQLWALAALLDVSRRRYRWWSDALSTMHSVAQSCEQIDILYVARPYDRRSYVLATFARRNTAVRVYVIFQGEPLSGNLQELHVPVIAVLTSKVNIPEAEYYAKQGSFKAAEVLYRPQEYLLESVEPRPPKYDIGFYSTGDWARVGGRHWASDIDKVRAGAYRGNFYDAHSAHILSALVGYARSHQKTLRIYLHPYERRLLNDESIAPPFAGLADGKTVTIDDRPGSSRDAHYESDVAVAVRSGAILERIDLGLERSYMYVFEDRTLGNILPEALGEYQRNLYYSTDDLLAKLDGCFGIGDDTPQPRPPGPNQRMGNVHAER